MKGSKFSLLITISGSVLLFFFNCFIAYGDTTGAGNALSFNGSSDFVSVPNSPTLEFGTTITVEAWVKPNNANNGQFVTADDNGNRREWDLSFWDGNGDIGQVLFLLFYSPVNPDYYFVHSPNPISFNTWTHVAGVYDGATIYLYINGGLVATTPDNSPIPNTGVPITIGNQFPGTAPYNGTMDEVRVWNIARSQSQIQSTMNCPLIGNETGLVGYWRFDEGSGLEAYDASGHENNGALGGSTSTINADDPAWVVSDAPLTCNSTTTTQNPPPNGAGNALEFDGVDDFVLVPNSPSLSFVTTLTVEAWINPVTISNLHGIIVNKDDFYGTSREFDLDVTANLQFEIFSSPSTYNYARDGDPSLNTWSHVAGVYDGTSIHLYLNGVEVASAPFTGFIPTTNVPISIGNSYTQDRPFDGTIDEVRIWNIAQSQSEIQANMNCPLVGDEAGLIGYWRFDEGSGQIAYDASGNGNNGYLGGATTANTNGPAWVASSAPLNCNSTTSTIPPYEAGDALEFNGVDDFVLVPDSPSLSFVTTLTVEAWINPITISNLHGIIVNKDDFYGTSREFDLDVTANLQFEIFSSPSTYNYARDGDPSLNTWSHVAGVYDGTSIHLYLNGVEVASAPFTGSIPVTNVPISIGNSYTQDRPFDGTIDEVRIWNIARSSSQIQSTMNCTLTGNETGLVGYWRFDEGSGQIAYDASGNENNGLLGGSSTSNSNDPTWVVSSAPLNCNSTTTSSQLPFIDFLVASDTGRFVYQVPPNLASAGQPTIGWLPSYNGESGVLEIIFTAPYQGINMTLEKSEWFNSDSGQWYLLKANVESDISASNTLSVGGILFNGVPPAETDMNADVLISLNPNWAILRSEQDSFINNSMYPQLTIRNNNYYPATVFIDYIQVKNIPAPTD